MSSSGPDRAERERRRRAAELLGDLLPSTTSDETDEGWGERGGSSRDDELLRDVPPHHG
ncbi:hypothetical protein [Aeromicrobium stalagmiti]|uniref:hypothetical protein n=1 Tax=Aeromicrobium stalagmiti TaxID=2738988 RepID=UPI001568803B|nr:hypothetical protein [Aeromicrobium stalagmiti]NRQ48316.1 hypothetical protein [Aeromicrobium stalagmiti]